MLDRQVNTLRRDATTSTRAIKKKPRRSQNKRRPKVIRINKEASAPIG